MAHITALDALNGPRKATEAAVKVADLLVAATLVKAAKMARIDTLAVRLSRHSDIAVRRYAAAHGLWRGSPATPILARDTDPVVRRAVAASPTLHTGEDTTLLALDRRPEVRAEVARRSDLAEPTANLLARDSNVAVRRALVANPHVTYPTLDILVHDREPDIRTAAAHHINAQPYHVAVARGVGRMLAQQAG